MSGGQLGTHIDKPYNQLPETRAAAARVISSDPDADLLLRMLGLADEKPRPGLCPQGHVLPGHGVCRRSQKCKAEARNAGGAR